MTLLNNMTIKIPSEEIQKMIEAQLTSEGYLVKSFKFSVEKRYAGQGMAQHEVSTFIGVECEVEKDK